MRQNDKPIRMMGDVFYADFLSRRKKNAVALVVRNDADGLPQEAEHAEGRQNPENQNEDHDHVQNSLDGGLHRHVSINQPQGHAHQRNSKDQRD